MALKDKEQSKYKDYDLNPGAMYGGAIYVSNARNFNVENSKFKNNAVNEQVNGENVKVNLNDIHLTGGKDPRWTEDIVMIIFIFMFLSKIEVNFTDIFVKDFYSNGTIINIEQATGSNIENFYIEDSVFDGILESQCNINIKNLQIKNSISQGGYADKKSLPAFNIKMNKVEISDSKIENFSCKSTVFNVQSYGELKIYETEFKDLYAKETIITRSYIGAQDEDPTPLVIDNCTFNGVSSSSSMLNLETGAWCKIVNSNFENIGFCPTDENNEVKVKNCESTDTGSFASLIHTAALNITNSKISNSNANNGGLFFIKHQPHLYLYNVTVINSAASEYGGVFWFGDFGGILDIKNCYFEQCHAEKGGVLAMSRNSHLVRDTSWKTNFNIEFNDCKFVNNSAEYGGVYFIGENSNPHEGITFSNSIFENNYAEAGGIGVCINDTTVPILNNYKAINNKAKYYADDFGFQPNQIDLLSVIAAHSASDNPLYTITDSKNSTFYFPRQSKIEYAKHFNVEYGNYTKYLTVNDEKFLLIQDGNDNDNIPSNYGDYDEKHIIKIPIENVGIYDKTVLPYIELLEKRTTVSVFKDIKTTTSRCLQYMYEKGINIEEYTPDKYDEFLEQLSITSIIFGKITNTIHSNIGENDSTFYSVPFDAISEESPLARAEWIKYVALFYNEEKLADDLFNILKEDYEALKKVIDSSRIPGKKTVAWVSYKNNKWSYHTSEFYRILTEDAGATLFKPNDNTGSFTSVVNNSVDIIIDISDVGVNEDIDSFKSNSGISNNCNSYNYCKNNNIFRFKSSTSNIIPPNNIPRSKNEVWNEHLLPMANTLLIELQSILSPDAFNRKDTDIWYHTNFLRRINEPDTDAFPDTQCYNINSSVIFERYATTENLEIQTLSGDWIPYSFMLGIKTFNGTNFKSKYDETTTDGALFITVIIVDRNNTNEASKTSTIYGKKRWRCNLANSTCSIPANEFQVIGDEGEYTLNFTIIENENWQFDTLINAYASVDININHCNRSMNKDITNTLLKSCYDPDCPGGCLHVGSECIDLNVCKCAPNWEGPNCNDRIKFVVPKWLQYMFLIIGITSAILCCILILMLYIRRNLQHVRSSSPLFLMIMTIGAVCNSGTIIFESRNDSIPICILREWCKYIGFSLMVGALIVKTIRISLIFSGKKIGGSQLADKRLIVYLFGILIPFIILLIIWTTVDKAKMVDETHTEKEFKKCSSHTTSIIGDVFLFAILFWAVHAAYTARNAPSAFNETKAIVLSTYVYFIIEVLVIVLQNLGSFDPTVSMTINCLATLVSTWCCLLFILKPKMKNMQSQMTPSQYSSTSQSQSEAYNSTIGSASMGTTSIGVKSGRL
ncbi:hypothetical protein PIROE2DRAFT_60777 [Piromyces sp. E2]|nr:hypothetical protein PIROE2DRAFT_60777 [Piromyces sp. E2]|eukprot:OUM64256.1 hypothetical protein PIROE2DRAFT_60777 [Piromyces sp. E2]